MKFNFDIKKINYVLYLTRTKTKTKTKKKKYFLLKLSKKILINQTT